MFERSRFSGSLIVGFTTEAQRAQSKAFVVRSGDGDRTEQLSAAPALYSGWCRSSAEAETAPDSGQKSPSPRAMAFFPGRRLPARENIVSSVSSVSPWFNLSCFMVFCLDILTETTMIYERRKAWRNIREG